MKNQAIFSYQLNRFDIITILLYEKNYSNKFCGKTKYNCG